MGFADVWEAEVASLIRDIGRCNEASFVGEEPTLLRYLLNFLAEPAHFIQQRKIMARVRVTKEIMDDFSNQALSPYAGEAKMARMPTLKERISLAVAQAQDRLAQVREAQEIFERNPDLEKLLNIMQKNHF